jgi:hypothetical protein
MAEGLVAKERWVASGRQGTGTRRGLPSRKSTWPRRKERREREKIDDHARIGFFRVRPAFLSPVEGGKRSMHLEFDEEVDVARKGFETVVPEIKLSEASEARERSRQDSKAIASQREAAKKG